MYTITTGGSSSDSRSRSSSPRQGGYAPRSRSSSSSEGSRSGSSRGGYSSRGPSRGGYRGGSSFGAPRAFNAKRSFKKDFIDEKLFINKEAGVTETDHYDAKHAFTDFGINEVLSANLTAKGLITPSPIQDQSIPVVLKGGDVIGIASTGTGKTAAFLIPLINKLVADKDHKMMILTPTRELAQQVEAEFVAFTKGMKLFSVSCVGGAPIMRQIKELELGVNAVIGTPGRVMDLIERRKINMEFFDSIVLDEADRMLDMGFIDDMRSILGAMPKEKQGLFFSATFSPEIKRLCSDFLKDPITVSVKARDTASSVMQDVVRVNTDAEKVEALHEILIKPEYSKVLIFREMKRHVDGLAEELNKRGFKALALHGDMHNRERERAVKALEAGKVQVVIATDVAARGLDISDISLVVNYDIPNNYETYIHRIGRTGRAKKLGHAITFVPKARESRTSRY
ncbi:DEAD/DEAH box helicase [Candidatus Gracilibacteria bacterium]|nr:DEAD/DEAH box helicase [Candidatus Gracilibacteria bacterium]MCF7898692.1 DEAD/DEAH box helicase [Candidatus Paceibacterota bacterium]